VITPASTALGENVRDEVDPQQAVESWETPGPHTFWQGRVAFYGILKALGVGPGDHVLVPGYTCFVVPSAIFFAGGQPDYVDIDPDTLNISLPGIEAACGAQTRAVLVQHTYGVTANVFSIVQWARRQGVAVIEDCAHALGSRYLDPEGVWHEVGTAGDAAFFSSHWKKPVSTGLGGWARVTNPRLEVRLRRFHDEECVSPSWREAVLLAAQVALHKLFSSPQMYWIARAAYQWSYRRGVLIGSSTKEELRGVMPSGYCKRMSGFQEWLLRRLLAKASLEAHRRFLKKTYESALAAAGLPVLRIPEYADAVLLCYPVRVRNKDQVLAEARRRWIELGDWYKRPVDRPEDSNAVDFGYRTGMCPEGERASREVVTLPMHAGVTETIALRTVDFLRRNAFS
jgi:dTDP-4-amino-4,6-dideoxygalactose transaminase